MTDQPNPDNIQKISYTGLTGQTADIKGQIVDGAKLRQEILLANEVLDCRAGR